MITGLKFDATYKKKGEEPESVSWTWSAVTLLTYLQQAWPGMERAHSGIGNKASPWVPKTAQQWFYCSKVKGSGRTAVRFPNLTSGVAWLKIGGRYIGIDPASFYATDYGTTGNSVVMDAPTYPNLHTAVSTWKALNRGTNTDAALTRMMRKLLAGEPAVGAPDALPVLTTVLFVSEVARNHTAFHTNLMALDLIEAGTSVPTNGGSIAFDWLNAIWMKDACPGCGATGALACTDCGATGSVTVTCSSCSRGLFTPIVTCRNCRGAPRGCGNCFRGKVRLRPVRCRDCGGTGNVTVNCGSCRGTGALKCGRCKGKGQGTVFDEFRPKGYTTSTRVSGGAQALQNGLLPMSHKGSAFGSAFDLTGTGGYTTVDGRSVLPVTEAPSPLTVVRRKEATVLTLWLQKLLDDNLWQLDSKTEVQLKTSIVTSNLDLSTTTFTNAYKELENVVVNSTALDGHLPATAESTVKDLTREKIALYIQMRTEALWYAFET